MYQSHWGFVNRRFTRSTVRTIFTRVLRMKKRWRLHFLVEQRRAWDCCWDRRAAESRCCWKCSPTTSAGTARSSGA